MGIDNERLRKELRLARADAKDREIILTCAVLCGFGTTISAMGCELAGIALWAASLGAWLGALLASYRRWKREGGDSE